MVIIKILFLIFVANLSLKNINCSTDFTTDDDDGLVMEEEEDLELTTTTIKPQVVDNKNHSDFDKFKNKLTKKAESIIDEITNDTKKYNTMRISAISDNKKKLDNDKLPILRNLDTLQNKRKKIENIISKIQDGVRDDYIDGFDQIKKQYRSKLETLNAQKSSLLSSYENNIRWEDDDDDSGYRDAPYSQYELEELITKIKETENNLENLNYGKHGKLSFAYSQLVDVYKEEQEELIKKADLESMNKVESISDIYSKNIIDIIPKLKKNVQNLINDAFDFIVLSKLYEWINFDTQIKNMPVNAVTTGLDIDFTPLYVIRSKVEGSFKYGKYAFNTSRKHAYLTDETKEFETMSPFELLTAKSFSWCESRLNKGDHEILPICRARYQNSNVPGTLLENNTCRIGFGWKTLIISNDFEVFSLNPCKVPETTIQYSSEEF